jgi:four helix bundle protein
MGMRFEALEVAIDLVAALRGLLEILEKRDRELAAQLRRAATSVPLNLAEGSGRTGQDRVRVFRIAAGSAQEVTASLRVALALAYVTEAEAAPALELVGRVRSMLWRLTS